ncbi:MAG: glycoside hydrolase family 3 C-terminal domain-containing protein [Clostridiales bacterium]|jgi:beta-glucosidase|nr:glycoside hydrolase family 3 C-terminal domain-containing protein [Clostridiales bacterium]
MEKYLDPSLSFETRAADLVSRMTLDEKISQTLHSAPEIPRLGLPAYNWWNEGLHGVARAGVATVFPQAIGLAAAFDAELMTRLGDVVSTEGRAKFNANSRRGDRDIYKGLTFWAPNVNLFRDPRWGRGHETYGEDPFLISLLAAAFIRGIQGSHPKYLKAAACAKHFAVHSGPEALRHEFDAVVSEKDLRETYLPAFAACAAAGVEIFMGAYNRVNGEPACGSRRLLAEILRGEWGFSGHVTSDCWAIKDFHLAHKVTNTPQESVALAINNGCDLNCGSLYLALSAAVAEGLVSEETITRSVTRLMTTRLKLGLFDPPESVSWNSLSYLENDTPEHSLLSLEAARRSLVLLKNDGSLPLNKETITRIAVVGPNADSRAALEGNYFGTASRYVTVLDGVRDEIGPGIRLLYAPGCHLHKETDQPLAEKPGDRLAEAAEAAALSDAIVLVLGLDANLEGEEGDVSNAFDAGDKKDLRFPGLQNKLLETVCASGKPVILVNMTGSAMDLRYAHEHCAAVIQAWYPGALGGLAVARLIFGGFSPSGKLPVTFYETSEELPPIADYSMRAGGGRTYRFMRGKPLYPFGYGLSYTDFEYSGLRARRQDGVVSASVTVRNTGGTPAYETSMLYLHSADPLDTPNPSLRAVSVNFLEPGQSAEVSFEVREPKVIDESGAEKPIDGRIKVYAGGSAPGERSEELTGRKLLFAEV